MAFPDPPTANCAAGADEISQFLFGELLRMLRVGLTLIPRTQTD
jgi:hypothetical protein